MEGASSTNATATENVPPKEWIQSQLALLNEQLKQVEAREQAQKSNTPMILAPASPSPRKHVQRDGWDGGADSHSKSVPSRNQIRKDLDSSKDSKSLPTKAGSSNSCPQQNKHLDAAERPKSNLVEGLEVLRQESKNHSLIKSIKRSSSFASKAERPLPPPPDLRALDLTVKINIKVGPIKFKPHKNDPEFREYEPNSHTRLNKRVISHQILQDHLSDRYVVCINELYAIVKKVEVGRFQSGNEWTIPLIGDWVLFGVIGQKSEFKTTNPYMTSQVNRINNNLEEESLNSKQSSSSSKKTPNEKEGEETALDDLNDQLQEEEDQQNIKPVVNQLDGKMTKKSEEQQQNKKGKRFVTFKLVDMSSSKISNSGSGVINMILFESDSYVPNGQESINKTYRGGSGGAYEKFWKEQPGTLIGILNPKILKSRRSSAAPVTHIAHMNEILTITPESAKSLIVIGHAKDLGTCVAKRLDTGKECGSWCDLRSCHASGGKASKNALAICDFHLQRQVGKVRAGRAEFFSGTSGMNTHTGKSFGSFKSGAGGYDPDSKTGLLPHPKATSINGQKTYICGGGSGSRLNPNQNSLSKRKNLQFSEPIDTEKLEGMKLKRKRELEEAQMKKILNQSFEKKDNYGLKMLQDSKSLLRNNRTSGGGRRQSQPSKSQDQVSASDSPPEDKNPQPTRRIFSTAAIRAIGFDPFQSTSKGIKDAKDSKDANGMSAAYDDLLNCHHKQSNLHDEDEDYEFRSRSPKFKPRTKDGKIRSMIKPGRHDLVDSHDDHQLSDNHHADDSELEPPSSFKKIKLDIPAPGLNHADGDDEDDDDDDDLIIQPEKT